MLSRMNKPHLSPGDIMPLPPMRVFRDHGESTRRKNTVCRQLDQLSATISSAKVPPVPVDPERAQVAMTEAAAREKHAAIEVTREAFTNAPTVGAWPKRRAATVAKTRRWSA